MMERTCAKCGAQYDGFHRNADCEFVQLMNKPDTTNWFSVAARQAAQRTALLKQKRRPGKA